MISQPTIVEKAKSTRVYSDYQKKYIDKTESVDKPLEYIGRD